jgi:hypothetical protein
LNPSKDDVLAIYLNDHLAGSVGAIEMIERLIKAHEGKPIEQFFKELHVDVRSDQDELRRLMSVLNVEESSTRKAGAWVIEKLSRPKLGLVGNDETTNLGLFQALEGLVLGIRGKEALWCALEMAAAGWPQLERLDLKRLKDRAINQGERVEAKRLEVFYEMVS